MRQAAIAGVTTVTAVVAAPGAGRRIVVRGYAVSLDTAGEILWQSASTNISGLMELAADTPLSPGFGEHDVVLMCAPNEALNLTATTAANGHLVYEIVSV